MAWVVVPAFAQTRTPGMVDALKDTPGLGTFANMIEFLDLEARYNNTDLFYTVFALEDDTAQSLLTDLGYEKLEDMTDTDKLTLSVILSYHFMPGAYSQATFEAVQAVVKGPIQIASALPGAVLTYDNGKIDKIAKIKQADIVGGSGYIHIVDNYLVPTKDAFQRSIDVATSDTKLLKDQADQRSIDQTLKDGSDFSMMTEALQTAGLLDVLDTRGPYTLFIMTDASLTAALDKAGMKWADVLADQQALSQLLAYHILPGQYSRQALLQLDQSYVGTMLLHTVVGFAVNKDETVMINQVPLVDSDIVASNGIIHVIDGVLLPPAAAQ